METHRTELAVVGTLGFLTALSTAYGGRGVATSVGLGVLGGHLIAKHDNSPLARKVRPYTPVLLGGAILGSVVVEARLYFSQAFVVLKGGDFVACERALMGASWQLAVRGLVGVSLLEIDRSSRSDREFSSNRGFFDPLYHVFNPSSREVLQQIPGALDQVFGRIPVGFGGQHFDQIDSAYDKQMLKILANQWHILTHEEKQEVVDGVWDGSWRITFSHFLEVLENVGDFQKYLAAHPKVEDKWGEKLAEIEAERPFSHFAGVIERIEKERAETTQPNTTHDRSWAQDLRPLYVFNHIMGDPQIRELENQDQVDALLGKEGQYPWFARRKEWHAPPAGKPSLASRFGTLSDGVLEAARQRDPAFNRFWTSLKPALPESHLTDDLGDDEEGAEGVLIKLYEEINPRKDQEEWNRLLEGLGTSQDKIATCFQKMGLTSEEVFEQQVLGELPNKKDKKTEIVDQLIALGKVEPTSPPAAQASGSTQALPSPTLQFSFPVKRYAWKAADLGLKALSIGLFVTYHAGQAKADSTLFVGGALLGGGYSMNLWKQGRRSLPYDGFQSFERDLLSNVMALALCAVTARVGRAVGSIGVLFSGIVCGSHLAMHAAPYGERAYQRVWSS